MTTMALVHMVVISGEADQGMRAQLVSRNETSDFNLNRCSTPFSRQRLPIPYFG